MNYLLLLLFSSIAFSQENAPDPVDAIVALQNLDGGMVAKIIGIAVGVQILLYGTGEALTRISKFTEAKWDNKAAEKISQAAWIMGSLISKFGYSVPKHVIEEKAKQMRDKNE